MTKKKIEPRKKSTVYAKLAGWLMAGSLIIVAAAWSMSEQPAQAADVVVYKSPTCGCCGKWVSHMQSNGFTMEVHNTENLDPIKAQAGVPRNVQSCHTAKVGGYIIEGHVPADLVQRLLKEKPDIKGLTVPGMVMGSPGMEGPRKDAYKVLAIQRDGSTRVYAQR